MAVRVESQRVVKDVLSETGVEVDLLFARRGKRRMSILKVAELISKNGSHYMYDEA